MDPGLSNSESAARFLRRSVLVIGLPLLVPGLVITATTIQFYAFGMEAAGKIIDLNYETNMHAANFNKSQRPNVGNPKGIQGGRKRFAVVRYETEQGPTESAAYFTYSNSLGIQIDN